MNLLVQYFLLASLPILALNAQLQGPGPKKPFKLSILAFSPAKMTMDGRSCAGAFEIAVNAVNSRTDILADYEIVPTITEEGPPPVSLVPKTFLTFVDKQRLEANSSSSMAPVLVGPFTFCQMVSHLSTFFKFVQLAYGCTAATFTANRQVFPNLYRATVPAEDSSVTGTFFVKYAGKWNEVAMITYAGNPNEFPSNRQAYQQGVASGISYPIFTSVLDVDDNLIEDVKQSGARAVVVATSLVPFIAKFLCLAYDHGMKLPRYVFLAPSYGFFSLDVVRFLGIPGCTREKMAEQFKSTFWTGIFFSAVENTGESSLGLNVQSFDKKLDQILNGSRPLDYVIRHVCYDVMQQALLVLDKADRSLKADYNKSLMHFWTDGDLVMDVINVTAGMMPFIGLRAGRMQYTKRLEMDTEPTWTAQAVDGIPRMVYKLALLNSDHLITNRSSHFDLKKYNVTEISQPKWFTERGLPPKDLSSVIHLYYEFPSGVIGFIVALVVCIFACEMGFIVMNARTDHPEKCNTKFANKLVYFSGLTLCIAAVVSLYSNSKDLALALSACYARTLLAIIGISTINITLFMRILLLERSSSETFTLDDSPPASKDQGSHQSAGSRSRSPFVADFDIPLNALVRANGRGSEAIFRSPSPRPATAITFHWKDQSPSFSLKWRHSDFVGWGFAVSLLFHCLFAFIFIFKIDPLYIEAAPQSVQFSVNMDSYYDYSIVQCRSKYDIIWIGALTGANAAVLMVGSCFVYLIRRVKPPAYLASEFTAMRISLINATALFIGFAVSLLIIPPSQTTLRSTFFSLGLVVFAASTSGILAFPTSIKPLIKKGFPTPTVNKRNNTNVTITITKSHN